MLRFVTQRIARQRLIATVQPFSIQRHISTITTIDNHGSSSGWLAMMGAALAAVSVHQTWNTSQCEEISAPIGELEEDDAEEDDPYANLPEEDEETDCSMCKTFRQGPCRPYWRKLERCFKDHEGEENGAVRCMRYFKPHQQCLMGYSNFYQLVSLEMKQELVSDLELSISEDERRKWNPKIDWSTYLEFTKETGLSYKETVQARDTTTNELLPLWKRLPDNKEPVLLTITSQLPKLNPETGMILKVAYAVDQDGYVLGLTYNKQYGELLEKSKGNTSKVTEDANLEENQANQYDPFEFDFFILPGETKSVRVCGLYSENPVDADPNKEILDALLFKSKSFSLKKSPSRQFQNKYALSSMSFNSNISNSRMNLLVWNRRSKCQVDGTSQQRQQECARCDECTIFPGAQAVVASGKCDSRKMQTSKVERRHECEFAARQQIEKSLPKPRGIGLISLWYMGQEWNRRDGSCKRQSVYSIFGHFGGEPAQF